MSAGQPEMRTIAKDIKARATDWLERRDRLDWNDQSQAELDHWLAASPANLVAYWRVESAWNRVERLVAVRLPKPDENVPDKSRPRWLTFFRSVAAVAVMIVMATGVAYFVGGADRQTYTTTVGGREILSLADGSQVELNTDTVLEVSTRAGERKIWLDRGEAYFQVVHDSRRPFLVVAGSHQVTDIGTKFSVRRDDNYLKVAVMEGKVGLTASNEQSKAPPLLLTRGDVAVATANAVSVTKPSSLQLTNDLGWRQGLLVFYHTPLEQAAHELNRYNRVKIIIADAAAGRQTVNGTFPASGVQPFVEVAQAIFGLRVQKRGGEILVSR